MRLLTKVAVAASRSVASSTMSAVWYVSYGSNMSSARLACYLQGGCPSGGTRRNPGARDRTPPRRSLALDLPGTTYFAGHSTQWGGGAAFYDDRTPGRTCARAYLVGAGQFVDIAAQEMSRTPQREDPIEAVLAGLDGGRHSVGPGSYETLVLLGRLDGVPLLTFTSPDRADEVEHTLPSAAYLRTIAAGLRESRGWDEARAQRYLDSLVAAPAEESLAVPA